MCSQMSPISATCCKKINSINILQHNGRDLLQNLPLAIFATFWFHNPCNIGKKCCVASASKKVPRVAIALLYVEHEAFLQQNTVKPVRHLSLYFLFLSNSKEFRASPMIHKIVSEQVR